MRTSTDGARVVGKEDAVAMAWIGGLPHCSKHLSPMSNHRKSMGGRGSCRAIYATVRQEPHPP
ncbi:MAG: hypothetical protein ACOVLE_10760, partial [Pirellula staleyi]